MLQTLTQRQDSYALPGQVSRLHLHVSEVRFQRLADVVGTRHDDDGDLCRSQDNDVHPGAEKAGQRAPEFV